MKRAYFVARGRFCNEYQLCYTESAEETKQAEAAGWERISRKEAIKKCAEERRRRKYDRSCSGYADMHIWPYNMPERYDFQDAHRYDAAYIIEKD